MSPFRILAATLALFFGLQMAPACAQVEVSGSGDPVYEIQNPPAYAMIGDLLIARPLLIVATVIGPGFSWLPRLSPLRAATWALPVKRWWSIQAGQRSSAASVARRAATASKTDRRRSAPASVGCQG